MATHTRSKPKRKRKSPTRKSRRTVNHVPRSSIDELLAAVRREPESTEARMRLADYLLQSGEHAGLVDVLEPVVTSTLGGARAVDNHLLCALAFGYIAVGKSDRAEELVDVVNQHEPTNIDGYFLAAYLRLGMADYDLAIRNGETYLANLDARKQKGMLGNEFAVTDHHRAQLVNIIGSAHLDAGQWDEAAVRFEESIGIDPGNCLPYLNLTKVRQRRDGNEAAREVIERGMQACRQVDELRMLAAQLQPQPTISACMIVKNEEELLPNCLRSIRDWVDEIIVVDTGSTDRTVEIAESFGARVYHQEWEGNFSKHRNYSMSLATCDWILIIDADEEVVPEDVASIRATVRDDRFDIVVVNVMNVYPDNPSNVTFLPSMRLIRRQLGLQYDGIVHNQLVAPDTAVRARLGARIKHYGYGLSEEKMNAKKARSRALLEKQLEGDPDNAFAHFNYAQLLRGNPGQLSDDDSRKIIFSSSRILELVNPEEKRNRHLYLMALDQLAWAYFKRKDWDKALHFCEQALAIRPEYLDTLHLLGHIYAGMNEWEKAREAFLSYLDAQARYNPSLEQDPVILLHLDSRTAAFYGLGLLAGREGDEANEEKWFVKTVELTPGYLNAAARLGEIELHRGNAEAALNWFRHQEEHGGPSAVARHGMGVIQLERGQHQDAIRLLEGAKSLDNSNPDIARQLLRAYAEAGETDKADALLADMETNGPNGPDAAVARARLHFQSGEYAVAAELFLRANREDSNLPSEVLNDLANCYYRLEEFGEAERWYREALEKNPQELSAHRNLGILLAKNDRVDEAIEVLNRTLELEPNLTDLAFIVGDLHSRREEWGEALAAYERRLRAEPTDALALFRVADSYLHMGHADSALLGFQRVLQLDPGFTPARDRLATLSQVAQTDGKTPAPT